MQRYLPVVACLIGLSLSFGCGSGNDEAAGPAPIKIGAIFALTGPTSDVGTTYAEGLRGFVEWTNQNGGVEGRPLELIFQDYGYKVDQAELLYTQFVQEGAVVFQGWGTGDTEALRGRIAADKVPFMSASYSYVLGNPDEAPYNFLVGTSYSEQLFILLDWILENHERPEAPSVALMHHPSPFGLSPFEQGGKGYAERKGVKLTAHEMARAATDYTAELTKIREEGARYVVFQNTSGPVSLVLKNARRLGLDIDFLCLNWCTNELLPELALESAEGVVGSMLFSPPGPGIEGLKDAEAYLSSRGDSLQEKGSVYGQGWWTMAVMIDGVRRVVAEGKELTGENIKVALESITDLDTGGVTFPITFTARDHRGSKGMKLFRVENGEWQPLTDFRTSDHAPTE